MKQWIIFGLFLALLNVSVHAQATQVDSISTSPATVAPGQTFTLYAYITNMASATAKDVQAILDLGADSTDTSFPFSIEPTDTLSRNLGVVPGFSTVQVKYQVRVDPSALDGSYDVVLRTLDSTGNGGTLASSVEIAARQPILTIIDVSPSVVYAGSTSSLEVTLKNTGSSPAYDIRLSVKEDRTVTSAGTVVERTILPSGAASSYTSILGAGEVVTVNMPLLINPSAESKPTFVPITLDYLDSAKNTYESTDYLGLKVSAEPLLDAIYADASPVLVPGKTSKLSIDLFNQGLGPAKFAVASIASDDFTFDQSQFFIGTIESDDFDSIIVNATPKSGVSAGEHSIRVSVLAKNEYGNPLTLVKEVAVPVFASVPNGNGGDSPLGLIVLLVLAGVAVWWFRFRKPKNGASKK
ncbi:MAG: hypothetical protein FJY86_03505 [Candidatus Diapherotrites archaeon]|uniref:CARDB domain-containing protein n=1 Tax=Candidatus Iainarchaeum sp. TaxID=3101447 RepID=A0A8T4C7B3_9ARCH|nr:hypothetical protein [Candidatus Diapherotrites archaeon]